MPVIGSPFSPEFMSLLARRKESIDDRNLRASIADREFQDAAKQRLLERMIRDDELKTQDRWKQEEMGLARERMGLDREEAQMRWGQNKELTDLEVAKAERERALAGKYTADQAKNEAQAKEVLELLHGKKGRQEADIKAVLARGGFDLARTETEDAMRDPKVAGLEAQTALTQAKTKTEEVLRDPRAQEIVGRIKNSELRTQAYQTMAEAQKMMAEGKGKDKKALLSLFLRIADLRSKTNPVFGTLVVEENPEFAEFLDNIESLIESEAGLSVQDAKEVANARHQNASNMMQKGHSGPGGVQSSASMLLQLMKQREESERKSKRK
jgi:hypothetical protein